VKIVARVCFAAAVAMFSAGLMIDKGAAGLAVVVGLALQALGLFLMTLR
jgi:hypothetical protein